MGKELEYSLVDFRKLPSLLQRKLEFISRRELGLLNML